MSHESYRDYKRAKRQFRNELIAEHDRYMTEVFRDIDQASECDLRLFWKLIKRQRPRNLSSYPEMEFNGILYDNPDEITKCFACHFQNIYNPVNCNNSTTISFTSSKSPMRVSKTVPDQIMIIYQEGISLEKKY